jgi:hypothetical protein
LHSDYGGAAARQPQPNADEPHSEHFSPAGEVSLVGWPPWRLGAQPPLVRITLEGPRTIMV